MYSISKGEIGFNVSSNGAWKDWFSWAFTNDNWEPETFKILKHFAQVDKSCANHLTKQENNGIYIDIGAWIGPTVMYASRLYRHVYALEPDPVANQELRLNLGANSDISNVTVIDQALSDRDGKTQFGGNGPLGNSQSTLLVNHQRFLEEGGEITINNATDRSSHTVTVSTIRFETFLLQHQIQLDQISLIKIDIEGGEWILIPALIEYLRTRSFNTLPPIYLSLHWMFLKKDQIKDLLIPIFKLYCSCYNVKNINDKDLGKPITIDTVLEEQLDSLVFQC